MEYSSKERIMTVLNGSIPDRVPIMEFLYSRKLYQEVIGRRPEFYNAEDVFDCSHVIGLDCAVIPIGGFAGIRNQDEGSIEFTDEWGITYRKKTEVAWPSDAPVGFPLKNRSDWNNYSIPDIRKEGRLAQIKIGVKKAREYGMAIIGSIRGPFTASWLLFGYEAFSIALYEYPDLIDEIITEITDFFIEGGKMLVEAGVDAVLFADDYGGSTGTLMSPEHFRRHIWPPLASLVGELQKTGIKVIMHSDGDLRAIISDIVSLTGINGYHPIERQANMNIHDIKKNYGQKLVLIGNVDNQGVLINGTPEEVEKATLECLSIGSPGGNYIFGSDHSVHDDMPNKNIFTMIEAVKRNGIYPIS